MIREILHPPYHSNFVYTSSFQYRLHKSEHGDGSATKTCKHDLQLTGVTNRPTCGSAYDRDRGQSAAAPTSPMSLLLRSVLFNGESTAM
jgi:hypothetical protein